MSTESAPLTTPLKQTINVTAQRFGRHWRELPYDELAGGPTLTRSSVANTLTGGIEGESWEEYLMLRQDDDSCSFVSMERIIGRIKGRSGSFVVQGVGIYEAGTATGRLTVVPGSGTGDLTGLRGEGAFVASGSRSSTISLMCELMR